MEFKHYYNDKDTFTTEIGKCEIEVYTIFGHTTYRIHKITNDYSNNNLLFEFSAPPYFCVTKDYVIKRFLLEQELLTGKTLEILNWHE